MAVNFLAPFGSHGGLLGAPSGSLTFERELRVAGVKSRVGPTLDAILESAVGTFAFEVKTMEPWRASPKVAMSHQYDESAERISDKTRSVAEALRSAALSYRCLDAAQLLKHPLGIHSALDSGVLKPPVTLVLLFWRPTEPGPHAAVFDELEKEFADFAARLDDQPVNLIARGTSSLISEWSAADGPAWLVRHAEALRPRYDRPLSEATGDARRSPFSAWASEWLGPAIFTGGDVPDVSERIAKIERLWAGDIPPGWQRGDDARVQDSARRYLRTHRDGRPKKPAT